MGIPSQTELEDGTAYELFVATNYIGMGCSPENVGKLRLMRMMENSIMIDITEKLRQQFRVML